MQYEVAILVWNCLDLPNRFGLSRAVVFNKPLYLFQMSGNRQPWVESTKRDKKRCINKRAWSWSRTWIIWMEQQIKIRKLQFCLHAFAAGRSAWTQKHELVRHKSFKSLKNPPLYLQSLLTLTASWLYGHRSFYGEIPGSWCCQTCTV